MQTLLLQTKFYILPPRPSLIKKLEVAMGSHGRFSRKLTLVSAPAGFGKTTLVSEWMHTVGEACKPPHEHQVKAN
jgi:LuxR family maltose regulon positive regulatory protein